MHTLDNVSVVFSQVQHNGFDLKSLRLAVIRMHYDDQNRRFSGTLKGLLGDLQAGPILLSVDLPGQLRQEVAKIETSLVHGWAANEARRGSGEAINALALRHPVGGKENFILGVVGQTKVGEKDDEHVDGVFGGPALVILGHTLS